MDIIPMPQGETALLIESTITAIMSRVIADGLIWESKQKIGGIELTVFRDREALLTQIEDLPRWGMFGDLLDLNDVRDAINQAPTADVVERVRGEWIEYQVPHIICCSECDWGTSVDDKNEFNFCPNCGADMRGEKHDR